MIKSRALRIGALVLAGGMISLGVTYGMGIAPHPSRGDIPVGALGGITKARLSQAIGDQAALYQFPSELPLDDDKAAIIQYSFDPKLQEAVGALMKSYSPDHGAFVAMDAATGRVISMVSYSRDPEQKLENLALRATFPSASVFKVVTAAAAIETQKYNSNTLISYSGRKHTLYKRAIFAKPDRWSRSVSLKSAFADSINSVFGKLGAITVGATEMGVYADRFNFNRRIAADIPVQMGHAPIPQDSWGLAETSSGYTRDNTMSPLQGAMMAAAIANRGVMMEPYVVQSVYRQDGTALYGAEPKVAGQSVDAATAEELKHLMRETVTHGTSRKSFRGFSRGNMTLVDVGGKTGSLTGMDPPGKYDWFIGYASVGVHQVAFAALTIHGKLWRVKSAYLVRRAIESYFKDKARPARSVAVNQ